MDLTPPRNLSLAARHSWDRIASHIHEQGRYREVDLEMLACFCECLELYETCKAEVDTHGVLCEGRTPRERVRNPALTPLNQARDAHKAGEGSTHREREGR
ncbi:MAG: P27 family phage terminase small subunit [Mycobacterium sp.]|jgi:P27 family predicted phage terminase small subunit